MGEHAYDALPPIDYPPYPHELGCPLSILYGAWKQNPMEENRKMSCQIYIQARNDELSTSCSKRARGRAEIHLRDIGKSQGCHQVMLLTGSVETKTILLINS